MTKQSQNSVLLLLVVELVSDSILLIHHQLHQKIKLEDMSEGVTSSEGKNVLHTVSVIRVRLDSRDHFRERMKTKHRFQKYCVKVKKPKRRRKRGHGWSQKGSKDTRRTKPLKRAVVPDYSEKTVKVKKLKCRKKRGYGWSKKGSKATRRRKSLKIDVEPEDCTVVPITNYYFTTRRVGPYPGCCVSRASECELPLKLGEFIEQLVDWFVNGGKFDVLEDSSCDCPHCPYSTGSQYDQRGLLLQRLSQLHHFS